MRLKKTLTESFKLNNSGQLSIDFIVGLSLFMIAFIIVSTMTSGLLIGLQSKTIDYDAVAYRTGVILAEDPGEIVETVGVAYIAPDRYAWDLVYPDYYGTYYEANMLRMGLAVPRYYYDTPPHTTMTHKIEHFFNLTRYNRNFYKEKIIFGDYPYNFNITITPLDGIPSRSVGDPIPKNYPTGYIRRIVTVKHPSNVTLNVFDPFGNANGELIVNVNFYNLSTRTPGYMVYPSLERIVLNLTNFSSVNTTITNVKVCSPTCENPQPSTPTIWIKNPDGSVWQSYPITSPGGIPVENGTLIEVDPGYLSRRYFPNLGPVDRIDIKIQLTDTDPLVEQYLGGAKNFSYTPDVTLGESFDQPNLSAAVLEVWVW